MTPCIERVLHDMYDLTVTAVGIPTLPWGIHVYPKNVHVCQTYVRPPCGCWLSYSLSQPPSRRQSARSSTLPLGYLTVVNKGPSDHVRCAGHHLRDPPADERREGHAAAAEVDEGSQEASGSGSGLRLSLASPGKELVGCARHTPLQICWAAPTLICPRGPLGPPGPHIVHPAPCLVCECFAFPASLLTKSPRSDSRCRRNHSMDGAWDGATSG